MGRKKKETVEEAHARGQTELADVMVSAIDEFLLEQQKKRELYPRNTKFIDLQIDAVEELRETLIYYIDDKIPQYAVQRPKK